MQHWRSALFAPQLLLTFFVLFLSHRQRSLVPQRVMPVRLCLPPWSHPVLPPTTILPLSVCLNTCPVLRKLRPLLRSIFVIVLRPRFRRVNRMNWQISRTSVSGVQANRANPAVFNGTDTERASQLFWVRPQSSCPFRRWNMNTVPGLPALSPRALTHVNRYTAPPPGLPEKLCIQRRQPIPRRQRGQMDHSSTHIFSKQPFLLDADVVRPRLPANAPRSQRFLQLQRRNLPGLFQKRLIAPRHRDRLSHLRQFDRRAVQPGIPNHLLPHQSYRNPRPLFQRTCAALMKPAPPPRNRDPTISLKNLRRHRGRAPSPIPTRARMACLFWRIFRGRCRPNAPRTGRPQ